MSTVAAPDANAEEWVDVRMTDPDEGEWELDAVVVEGRMEHVDLRVREDLVASFVACLTDGLPRSRVDEIRSQLAGAADVTDDEAPSNSPDESASAQ